MNETTLKKRKSGSRLLRIYRLCPRRHFCLLVGLLVICAHFLLRDNRSLMNMLTQEFVHPYHRFASRVCSLLPFSVAELLVLVFFLSVIIYLICSIVRICTRGNKLRTLYITFISLACTASLIYGGFCLLWGVYYYSDGVEELSGIPSEKISMEQLKTVTTYFADIANACCDDVPRDENGLYSEDVDALFDRSRSIYSNVSERYAFLGGPDIRPKPLIVSEFMSYINFTGFFFPFTGEANLNIKAPICLLPSTIAHEQAHQRGVAAEQEANFAAVLCCMECDDVSFTYSGALLAYIHLGNALYSADRDAWEQVYFSLDESVRADLRANNAYWDQYETKAADVSEELYEGFLQSYGQELGMKSYGACVDLLVNYYYETAAGGMK